MAISGTERQTRLKETLIKYYEKHNPTQVVDSLLDEIVNKYLGKELQLSNKLKKRYGHSLDLVYLGICEAGAQGSASSAPPQAAPVEVAKPIITDAERLDFTSAHFDPLRALQHEGLLPPIPDAPPLDNLSKFRALLDPDHPDYIDPTNKTQPNQPGKRAAGGGEASESALEGMSSGLNKGPFSLLHRCFTQKRRVTVLLRRVDGVRGTCQGYLRAFDRHMNLVLAEAEETFLVLPPRPKEGTQHRRTEHRKRGKRAGQKRVKHPRDTAEAPQAMTQGPPVGEPSSLPPPTSEPVKDEALPPPPEGTPRQSHVVEEEQRGQTRGMEVGSRSREPGRSEGERRGPRERRERSRSRERSRQGKERERSRSRDRRRRRSPNPNSRSRSRDRRRRSRERGREGRGRSRSGERGGDRRDRGRDRGRERGRERGRDASWEDQRSSGRERGQDAGAAEKGAREKAGPSESRTEEGVRGDGAKAGTTPPHPSLRRRMLRQVLVRGDNVIMVWEGDRGHSTGALEAALRVAKEAYATVTVAGSDTSSVQAGKCGP